MKCQNKYCDSTDAEKRRQNTAYVDDDRNFAVLCDECQKEANEYWRDQWNDYYQGCM
jgi:hypothetical protein